MSSKINKDKFEADLQTELDENGRVSGKILENSAAASGEVECYQKLFAKIDKAFAPEASDFVADSEIDLIMGKLPSASPARPDKSVPASVSIFQSFLDKLNFSRLQIQTALVFSLVLTAGILFLSFSGRQNEPLKTTSFDEMLKLTSMVAMLDSKDGQIVFQGKKHKDVGKSLESGVEYQLEGFAELSLTSSTGTIIFRNQARFSLHDNFVKLAQGEIYCTLRGDHKGFYIETGFGRITPIGTSFLIQVKDRYVKVSLYSGALEIQSASGNLRKLAGNEQVFISPEGTIAEKLDLSEDQKNDGQIKFPSEPTKTDNGSSEPGKSPDSILDTL